jgi:acyl-coenzyme A synthetase/AMP-(fatty) acid ligase
MGSLDTSQSSPAYGQRFFPPLIDERARELPNRIIFSFAKTDDPSDGFLDVTALQFANAINRAAWWIKSYLDKGSNYPTVGHLGPGGPRYQILRVALVKVGFKGLLISPRNSLKGDLNVIDKRDCHIWLLPFQRLGNVEKILKVRQMKIEDVPELTYFLDESPVSHHTYEKIFAEAQHDPFVTLHASGSTGLPKPIVLVHGLVATLDSQRFLVLVKGRILLLHLEDSRIFSAFLNFPVGYPKPSLEIELIFIN